MNQQRALLIALRDEEIPDEEEVKKDIYKSRESDKLADGIDTDGLDNVLAQHSRNQKDAAGSRQ